MFGNLLKRIKSGYTSNVYVASTCAFFFSLGFILARIVLAIAGVFIIPFLLEDKNLKLTKTADGKSDRDVLTFVKGKWFWIFGNDYDGIDGDKKGNWKRECDNLILFGLLPLFRKVFKNIPVIAFEHPLAMYWWLAIRNPVNNLRLVPFFSCEVKDCDVFHFGDYTVEDTLPELQGQQLVIAYNRKTRVPYFGYYCVLWWKDILKTDASFFQDKIFRVRIGFKVKPIHAGQNEPAKGFAFSIKPLEKA